MSARVLISGRRESARLKSLLEERGFSAKAESRLASAREAPAYDALVLAPATGEEEAAARLIHDLRADRACPPIGVLVAGGAHDLGLSLLADGVLDIAAAPDELVARLTARFRPAGQRPKDHENRPLEYLEYEGDLLEANRSLRELNHQKDELLATCAHNLQDPLRAIRDHARSLSAHADQARSTDGTQAAEAIEKLSGELLVQVAELLEMRSLRAGTAELQRRQTDLCALVRTACENAKGSAPIECGVTFAPTIPDEPIVLAVDATRLLDALVALLSDALRTARAQSVLRVDLCAGPEGPVLLRVATRDVLVPPSDEPPGAASESKEHATDVAMARLIIELHGGRLWLGGEGRGGLFEIRLPSAKTAPAQHPSGRERALVLLIEDDPDTREIVCEILGQTVEVLAAADGEEGLRLARDRLPDLVITDLFLPRLDGFGVIEELSRDPRVAETPVMILSAAGSDPLKVRGLNLGAADYVAKPFSARELVARVERLLRMARQRDALKELAQTDALTDLPNFRAFRLRLDEEFKRSRRYRVSLACAMIDLDHLKAINDRLGHATGNRALATFAQTLRQVLRETDFAGRYGGDEFVLLLPHTSEEEAAATAERIQRQLAGAYLGWGGERLPLRASVGVAACTGADDETAEGLWQAADAALYTAKVSGRNRVVCASSRAAKTAKASPAY